MWGEQLPRSDIAGGKVRHHSGPDSFRMDSNRDISFGSDRYSGEWMNHLLDEIPAEFSGGRGGRAAMVPHGSEICHWRRGWQILEHSRTGVWYLTGLSLFTMLERPSHLGPCWPHGSSLLE